ncbi:MULTISPECIES: hypothetical protein [unclassified Streptomyces]|uniref:hypothetical protein n=1 Tax=Streptomycetaceae TaxID=2062 RepID=UPI002E76DD8E|nr:MULTISPECIES: hypothetical protein [unclassified Streptomyces]MED7951677.1 hypothetical protein [Streptomyces sp. BE303]MEE1828986.1 hypothetical protein [Streptomyces sp. BE20]
MRTMHRILAATAVVLPLAVCGATVASADAAGDAVPVAHFDKGSFAVGPDGSALHLTSVHFGPDGASYFDGILVIGQHGVAGTFTDTGIGLGD